MPLPSTCWCFCYLGTQGACFQVSFFWTGKVSVMCSKMCGYSSLLLTKKTNLSRRCFITFEVRHLCPVFRAVIIDTGE